MERRTTSKTIRLTDEELRHFARLLHQHPEVASEAEMLRQATQLGLYVLAAHSPDLAGFDRARLAALLRYRIVGALDLLLEQGALPASYQLLTERVPAARSVLPAEELAVAPAPAPLIDASAADDLAELGTDFL